jgi:hypothetical protein
LCELVATGLRDLHAASSTSSSGNLNRNAFVVAK